MTSPFDVLARYWQVKAAHPAPSATPRRRVRGTFGHGDSGTIPGLAPKDWNGAQFSARHGGAYSKAGPVLVRPKGNSLNKGQFIEPTIGKKGKK